MNIWETSFQSNYDIGWNTRDGRCELWPIGFDSIAHARITYSCGCDDCIARRHCASEHRKVRFGTGRCPFPWREKACLFNASRNTEKRLSVYPADTHASSPSLKTDFRVQGFLSGERNSYRGTKSRNFYISTWLYRNSCAISSDEKFFFSRRNIGEKKLGECFKGKKVSRVKSAYIKRDETFYGNLRFLLENDLSLSLSLR